MKKLTVFLFAALLAPLAVSARQYVNTASTQAMPLVVDSYRAMKSGNMMEVAFTARYESLDITPNEELVVTPLIVNRGDTLRLDPIVFRGNVYDDKVSRAERLYGGSQNDNGFIMVMSRRDLRQLKGDMSDVEAVEYRASVPYDTWMDNSQLKLEYVSQGCCRRNEYMADMGPFYSPVTPRVLFVTPEIETVKVRRDTMTARVMFLVDRYDINPRIFDNSSELQRIYDFTENVTSNKDLSITGLVLTGYASPEGSMTYNDRLSKNRVNSLKDHLMRRYDLKGYDITTDNVPEDWDGLKAAVEKSDMRYKREIVGIIESVTDPDARDAQIKALDNGATYNMLLKDFYPRLRRVHYAIDYTVEPFTVEKGKEVIKTNPAHLSLHEFYEIARSYPADSPEYAGVLTTALTYFPDDTVANHNMAAVSLKKGDYRTAERYIQKSGRTPEAMNNLGVAYALQGRYEDARQAFAEAVKSGSAEAEYNLNNIYSLR